MKGAYFFITFLITLISFDSKGQAVSNGEVNHGKKTINTIIPPQLSYPANKSDVVVKNPVFIWIPPRPSTGMMVSYSIRLVEVQNGQTAEEALLQNPPLLELNGLTSNFLSYPADAPALQANTQYAWQVAASSQGQSLGLTDVSSFSVKKPENKKEDDIEYPVASKVNKEHFYLTHGVFHLVYNNTTNEKTLSYTIKSMGKSMKGITDLPVIKLNPGINKVQVDLQQSGMLKTGTYYYLEIKDKRQQTYKLVYYYMES